MKTILNNEFAAEPLPIMYYADQIAVCENIRSETVETPEGETETRWFADTTYYTPDEYTAKQDNEIKLAEDRAVITAFEATLELIGGN